MSAVGNRRSQVGNKRSKVGNKRSKVGNIGGCKTKETKSSANYPQPKCQGEKI